MIKLTKKIVSFINFIKLFSNWHNAILCWYSKKNDIVVLKLRNGTLYNVRPGKSDIQMIIELYIGKSYHANLAKLAENPVIIDIGANIGVFSVFITKFTGSKIAVYSYEPFPDNYKILQENIKINKLKSVKAFPMAVGNSNKERLLGIDINDNAMHSFFIDNGSKIPVKTTTLEEVFNNNNLEKCDFLKIDCEGAEYEIILNTSEHIMQKINILSIEYHYLENFSYTQLKGSLEKMGFNVTVSQSVSSGFGFIDAVRI